MKINLRKASAIIKTLQYETLQTLHGDLTSIQQVNLSAIGASVESTIAEKTELFNQTVYKTLAVTEVLYKLREAVNTQKEAVGINALLCKLEACASQIGVLKNYEPTVRNIQDVNLIVTQFAKHLENPLSGYSSSTRYNIKLSDESLQVLTNLRKLEKDIKDNQLLTLNVNSFIEIDETIVAVLTDLDLL